MRLLLVVAAAVAATDTVTLSITTTVGEDIGRAARAIVGALASPLVVVRRAVVDADPARAPPPVAAQRAHDAAIARLLEASVLTESARVDYSASYLRGNGSVFARVFGRDRGPVRNRRGRGFLAYLFEIDTCATRYLLHLDSDTRVYGDGSRDAVADLVSLPRAHADVLGSALPVNLGTANCTLDPVKDREILRRAPPPAAVGRGFADLGDLSTQFYLLDRRKLAAAYPLPFRRANAEDALSALRSRGLIVAAMLPHARPPRYFRGQGRRFARDVAAAAGGGGAACGRRPGLSAHFG